MSWRKSINESKDGKFASKWCNKFEISWKDMPLVMNTATYNFCPIVVKIGQNDNITRGSPHYVQRGRFILSMRVNLNRTSMEPSPGYKLSFQYLIDWPVMKCNPSPGNFQAHFLFNSKIKTTYPGVHPPISSLALRPKLGLWWSY